MPPTPQAGVTAIDVPLRPDEMLAAWRPESRRLVLPAREPIRLQQRVAARIALVGIRVAATITGRVVSVSPLGNHHRIELVPDDTRVRAVEKLLAVARGEPADYRTRIPRFLASMPAVVSGPGGPTYMTTFSVSEKGCGLAWSGPVPAVGDPMDVRLGAGSRAVSFRSVVCWTAQSGRTATVGVRFLAGATGVWATMITDVKRSGAPLA
ncbi:MAG TPA: PilZ domain-containing protein [Anaeromyxobacteraceae bacterium]|nr:PilZ domain-containing protein [Anaeromyxobacteraceae bacterium]